MQTAKKFDSIIDKELEKKQKEMGSVITTNDKKVEAVKEETKSEVVPD